MIRVAAVDYGRRRVGLAVSDPLGITVRGLPTAEHAGTPETAAEAAWARLAPLGPGRVLVGLPLHASGEESEMSREARVFGEILGRLAGVPVEFVDEGLTSWAAEETLRERGRSLRRARQDGEVDREAARALLLGWLREREAAPPPPDPGRGAGVRARLPRPAAAPPPFPPVWSPRTPLGRLLPAPSPAPSVAFPWSPGTLAPFQRQRRREIHICITGRVPGPLRCDDPGSGAASPRGDGRLGRWWRR